MVFMPMKILAALEDSGHYKWSCYTNVLQKFLINISEYSYFQLQNVSTWIPDVWNKMHDVITEQFELWQMLYISYYV